MIGLEWLLNHVLWPQLSSGPLGFERGVRCFPLVSGVPLIYRTSSGVDQSLFQIGFWVHKPEDCATSKRDNGNHTTFCLFTVFEECQRYSRVLIIYMRQLRLTRLQPSLHVVRFTVSGPSLVFLWLTINDDTYYERCIDTNQRYMIISHPKTTLTYLVRRIPCDFSLVFLWKERDDREFVVPSLLTKSRQSENLFL